MFGETEFRKSRLLLQRMPRQDVPEVLYDRTGKPVQLRLERLMGFGWFQGSLESFEFKLDTGAFISVFPQAIWRNADRRGIIEWLRESPVHAQPKSYDITGYGGGMVPCRLGLVPIEFRYAKQTFQRTVVAACEMIPTQRKVALLGLGGEAHVGGGTCLNYDDRVGWLVTF